MVNINLTLFEINHFKCTLDSCDRDYSENDFNYYLK